jgi:hypothetical protein
MILRARRIQLFRRALFLSAGIVAAAPSPLLRADPLVIGDSRQLFLDHYLIEQMDNVRLQLAQPHRAEVSVKFDQPWEHSVNYATVIKNGPLYQLYYRGIKPHQPGETDADDEVTCYAESPDGIHWTKPALRLVAYETQAETNIILGADRDLRISHNFGPWLDTPRSTRRSAGSSTTTAPSFRRRKRCA